MQIRLVEKKDLKIIADWYKNHGQEAEQADFLSDIGFIVDNIAAAFLYTTNSSVCWIESYISNPESNKKDRKKALDLITEAIIQKAKDLGFMAIICFIDLKTTYQRCLDYGFVPGTEKIIFTKRI